MLTLEIAPFKILQTMHFACDNTHTQIKAQGLQSHLLYFYFSLFFQNVVEVSRQPVFHAGPSVSRNSALVTLYVVCQISSYCSIFIIIAHWSRAAGC